MGAEAEGVGGSTAEAKGEVALGAEAEGVGACFAPQFSQNAALTCAPQLVQNAMFPPVNNHFETSGFAPLYIQFAAESPLLWMDPVACKRYSSR